ncbi:MAG: DNRLRE domain-containing protein [Actinomycetota bacterium]|nr:DNRLRE domain-containing protein [Actinomycetota bacterium]
MARRTALRPALIAAAIAILAAAAAALLLSSASASDDEPSPGEVRQQGRIVRELPELRTSRSRTFATDARTNVTRTYSEPVNFRENGKWQLIDNDLEPDATPGYALENAANGYELALPDSLAAEPVEVADGPDSVRFSLDGAAGTPQAHGNEARYADALPGVDVTYQAQNNAVKESLILGSAAAGSKFSFTVEASEGLRARKNDAGGIDFVRDGEVRLSFAPPYMEDSAPTPVRSQRVSFDLREEGSGYKVVLRADPKWLRDPGRVYPVTIDPTTEIHTNDDCYMASGSDANSSFCGYTDPWIQIGTDAFGSVRRGFMRADTSAIPKTAEVLEGELHLYVESGTQRNVDLHRVTRQSTSARTWNKYDGTNAWTTAGGDISASPDGSESAFGGAVGLERINARKLVQGWVDGSIPNYGLIVKDNGSTAGVLNITGDSASNDPLLEIEWAHRVGEQDRWTFAEQKLSDRMTLKTNVANGNLILKEADIQIPGIAGHDLDFSRFFNNLEYDSVAGEDLGLGWRMSTGYDVWLRSSGLGTTQNFNGPSDFWAPYDKSGTTSYTTPTGMNADLVKNTDGSFKLTYRQSNRKLNFSSIGELSSDEDRNGNKISFAYNGTGGKLLSIKDTHDQGTANNTLSFTYTGAGYIDKVTDRTTPTVRTWDYNYTGDKLTSYVNPDGKTTSYSYDANENLYEITDPRGNKTRMLYDSQYRVTSIQRFTDAGNTTGPITRYEYPTTLSSQCQGVGSGEGTVVGETIEKDPLWTSGTAHTTKYCWDKLLRVQKTIDGRGESRSKSYTSNSDVTTLDSMGAQAWNLSFDDDRAKEASSPTAAGQSAGLKMTYGYPNDSADPDRRSNPLHWLPSSLTDTQNKTTDYTYDSEGNLTEVKLPLSGTPKITIGVNANGTTSSITDAKTTGTTSYTYESDGDLDTIDRPSTLLTETMDYDVVHRLTSHANASMPGVTETYGYDKVDRMTSVAFNAANSVTYAYDDNGNMTTRVDATGTSTYVYDKLNRLTQENLPGGRTNNYTYDAASNLATLQDAGGTTTYTYGASNLLATMQAPGDSAATSFTYNKDAQRVKTSYPNGVVLTMDFEDKMATDGTADSTDTGPNRLKSIEAKKTGGSVLTKSSYGFTPDTTLCGGTNADTSLRHSVTNKDGVTSKYCYDALNRLTKASNHNGSTYDYTLDANGNITKRVKGATTTSFGFDTANRMCWQVSGSEPDANCDPDPTGATTYAYDSTDQGGSLDTSSCGLNLDFNTKAQTTSMTGLCGGGTTAMTYAGTNQLERFTAGGTTFTNNALGVGAETTGTSTTYYRRDNQGGLVSERLASTGNPIYYYAFDGLGSVSALTDSAGAAPALYSYEPYGETTASGSAPTTHNPWRYTSSYLDSTGFYKMGMRYYRPELMRWTQQDPVEQPTDALQAMLYGYAGGNPINAADPMGLALPGQNALSELGDRIGSGLSSASRWGRRQVGRGFRAVRSGGRRIGLAAAGTAALAVGTVTWAVCGAGSEIAAIHCGTAAAAPLTAGALLWNEALE